jgi:hypothetical protein
MPSRIIAIWLTILIDQLDWGIKGRIPGFDIQVWLKGKRTLKPSKAGHRNQGCDREY